MVSTKARKIADPQVHCEEIMLKVEPEKTLWRLGKTMVGVVVVIVVVVVVVVAVVVTFIAF